MMKEELIGVSEEIVVVDEPSNELEKIWHVYVDCTTEEVPRAFYVGKGNESRIKTTNRNKYWKRIAAKYGHTRTVLLSTKDEDYAFELEIETIYTHKTFEAAWADGSGFGANFTMGGEGSSGWRHSEESNQRNREAHIGVMPSEETRQKMSISHSGENNYWFGRNLPEETKKLISLNHADVSGENNPMWGETFSDEHRAKISKALTGKKSPLIGIPLSEEHRQKVSLNHADVSGESNPAAKLNEEDVRQILCMIKIGISYSSIAEIFNVTKTTISAIKRNKTWKHITREYLYTGLIPTSLQASITVF